VKPSIPAPLQVTITAPASVTRGEAVVLTVGAANHTASKAQFGYGSSSCQLGAVVRVDGNDCRVVESRPCTADIMPLELGPGEQRTEEFEWSGEVLIGAVRQLLPPGVYELRGQAGDALSPPVTIEVK
jgi:hypothetical protein